MAPDPRLVGLLQAVLRAGPPLRLALLFGSVAEGTEHAGSDVDVAILPEDPALPLAAELSLQSDLSRAAGCDVDLVRLDTAPTLVKWQVARSGFPLLVSEGSSLTRFIADAASEWLDFAPALRHAEERFRRRLAAAGTRPA